MRNRINKISVSALYNNGKETLMKTVRNIREMIIYKLFIH